MNAYELADELQEMDSKLHLINLFKSANMLRQQADRIAELEKQSAEPVAWINQNIDVENGKPQLAWHKDNFAEICKPLYTTPQIKELSDEEIQEISHDFGEIAWLGETTYKFARAILKKASEK